ncbi:alpha-ketoglutarate-dependent dioxygenase AlkB [Kitasatospora sp. NPDC051170]|uniref:alpha-ketoglutarate-dependent dioxygenase AlkB n=1 Tax=Kitasatospora sp. NPDC051170 TaxID=3364056 RepID=UPI0037B6690E
MHPVSSVVSTFALPAGPDLFAELAASVRWEDTGKGRRGAVLTRVDDTGGVPLVRTTTRYATPAQRFTAVHERLAQRIQHLAALPHAFNNALIETYTNTYRTMGAHSDQALDLAEDSSIAVLSCYRHPDAGPPRKLIFEPKAPDAGAPFEIPLAHHGVVVFSTATNRRLRHRIVLDTPAPDNQWLGVTYRTSKTPLHYHDGHPHLPNGTRLTLADDDQQREFYALRRRENTETDFAYPPLTYTVSPSDLTPPA